MNFSEWVTQFDVIRQKSQHRARLARQGHYPEHERQRIIDAASNLTDNPIMFYQIVQRQILESIYYAKQIDNNDQCTPQCLAYNQASIELAWYESKKPYFKLYPGIIGMLTNTDVNVPVGVVHAPLGTISLRLPDDHGIEELTADDSHILHSILINEVGPGEVAKVSDMTMESTGKRQFIFWFNFGEKHPSKDTAGFQHPVVSFQVVEIDDEEASFEECLQVWIGRKRYNWDVGLQIRDETMLYAIRLAVGTCLLATNADKVLEADVLNKHVQRYRNADAVEQKAIHQKAIKRGKHGWLVGREISLPSLYGCSETHTDDGVHRQLTRSHLRRGHFHTVRHGKGRALTKVQWFKPVIVRSDLPASEVTRGYKTDVS